MSIKQDILWRLYLSFSLVFLGALAIAFQSFRIQVFEGDHWRNMADSITTAYHTIEADRGNIYSTNHDLLATSIPYYDIRMDVNSTALDKNLFYQKLDSLALCLSNCLKNKTKAEYKQMLLDARRNGNRYLMVASEVTYPQLQKIKQFPIFRKGRYKGGFMPIKESQRIQPFRMLADRTIGYTRKDNLRVGLEGYYNEYLKGVEGKQLMQRIAGDTWVPVNEGNQIEPKNGKDLITTLDTYIQDVAENALLKQLKEHEAHHGSVVVMEVSTGKVRALANIGKTATGQYWENYNYAVGESSEPGSVFKLASLMAALEDGYVNVTDSVNIGNGSIKYYDRKMEDVESDVHGNITVRKAFEISSNVGISKIIYDNYTDHPHEFINTLESFRISQPTGIDIKGEPRPFIKNPDSSHWSGTTLPWMSVGYEVKLTPLQVLTFYNAVANQGKMMQPYLGQEIQKFGQTYKKFSPTVLSHQIASQETIENMHSLLKGVVQDGTAQNIQSKYFKIAGKTGTAKIAQPQYGYGKIYQASFVGYFPAQKPKYSCIVVINNPTKGGYYGSIVAAPVFKEIADELYAHKLHFARKPQADTTETKRLNTPYVKSGDIREVEQIFDAFQVPFPDLSEAPDSLQSPWIESIPASNDSSIRVNHREVIKGLVPNVKNMSLEEALPLLENHGLTVKIEGKKRGKVRSQSIPPGTKIANKQTVTLKLN